MRARRGANRRSERAAVAGAESLALAVLVLLGGSVMVANLWTYVDARTALHGAARSYLAAYTSADHPLGAAAAGREAMAATLVDRPRLAASLVVAEPDVDTFGPCAPATVEISARIPVVQVPLLGDLGNREVMVRQEALVDAHRELAATGTAHRSQDTPCG